MALYIDIPHRSFKLDGTRDGSALESKFRLGFPPLRGSRGKSISFPFSPVPRSSPCIFLKFKLFKVALPRCFGEARGIHEVTRYLVRDVERAGGTGGGRGNRTRYEIIMPAFGAEANRGRAPAGYRSIGGSVFNLARKYGRKINPYVCRVSPSPSFFLFFAPRRRAMPCYAAPRASSPNLPRDTSSSRASARAHRFYCTIKSLLCRVGRARGTRVRIFRREQIKTREFATSRARCGDRPR